MEIRKKNRYIAETPDRKKQRRELMQVNTGVYQKGSNYFMYHVYSSSTIIKT